jgi:hypothetical protein
MGDVSGKDLPAPHRPLGSPANGVDKGLTVTHQSSELSPVIRMDLEEASKIVGSIVATPESLITPDSLHPIPFSQEQAHQAIMTYADHLVAETPDLRRIKIAYKPLQGGTKLALNVAYNSNGDPDFIYFSYGSEEPMIIFNYRDALGKHPFKREVVRFTDKIKNREVTQNTLRTGDNLDDYRFLWRGLRWMGVNFMRWKEKDVAIMPDDLDRSLQPGLDVSRNPSLQIK